MKVGILSMQRVINYGSFLQAYALKKTIENLKYEAYFVDIKEGRHLTESLTNGSGEMNIKLSELPKRIEHVLFVKRRDQLFREQLFMKYGINSPKDESELDRIVVGSDEVFNCLQKSPWGFSLQLLGDTAVPAISYAASAGYTNYEKLSELGLLEEVAGALKKYKSITVRDQNTSRVVREISGIEPQVHFDPVLIYDWKKEAENTKCRFKDYILVYGYDNRINKKEEISAIKRFAKEHGKKLISFGVYQRWCDKNVLCDPFQLIGYFLHADYVITDTFHGTVLSIKCNRPFATIIRDSNKNKISDLLSRFNLENRAVDIQHLGAVLDSPINYDIVNKVIRLERERTLEYLKKNLRT